MENKATISYSFSESGDENLFLTLSTKLVDTLSTHTVDWHRAYARTTHSFHLKVKILPLTSALLERQDLVTRPYCHIFWTDCNDVDQYRSTIKGDITSWLNLLSSYDYVDWIIVVIAGDILSRITKPKLPLPRSSITDRLKSDFCSKNPERIHVLHEPHRESTKSSESWMALGYKIASMTVKCMETVVSKYEDQVRSERERRNDKSWDFCTYFLLQEELAFMYEMLDMYSTALVQYDELDAMFTQYVLNANAGDTAHWLSQFSKPITRWHSLLLWKHVDSDARQMIINGQASVIDIRNYLFNRLCQLLFRIGKVTEITQRMHHFLHSLVTEIEILEISIPDGALECWIFMCCLELVEALKLRNKIRDDNQDKADNADTKFDMTREELLLENASLWNLARLKLFSLGRLCGLMPDDKTTSSHLQRVVDLLAGMGEGEERGDSVVSPALVLREALSSKSNFEKHYFELSELAMGTFKHMGHYRAARSVGSDLAEFYLLLGKPEQAESYLVDAVRMYAGDGWELLHTRTNKILAKCYRQMLNIKKYLRLCYALMCDKTISAEERMLYCDEYCSMSTDLGNRTLAVNVWPLANITSVRFLPAQSSFRIRSKQNIDIYIESMAPKSMVFQSLQISLEQSTDNESILSRSNTVENFSDTNDSSSETAPPLSSKRGRNPSAEGFSKRHRHASSASSRDFMIDQFAFMESDGSISLLCLNYSDVMIGNRPPRNVAPLNLQDQNDVQKDGEIAWAGLTCKRAHEILRRQDSNPSQRSKYSSVTSVTMETYDRCLSAPGFTLHPGKNRVRIPVNTETAGAYQLQQLRLCLHKTYFVLPRIYPIISYIVTNQKPSFILEQCDGLICGLVREITLVVNMGDHEILDNVEEKLTFEMSSKIRLLKVTKCLLSSAEDGSKQVDCPDVMESGEAKATVQLPSCSYNSTITFNFACICFVDDVVQQRENYQRHRRTHSAPPNTLARSPKRTPKHRPIAEQKSIEDVDKPKESCHETITITIDQEEITAVERKKPPVSPSVKKVKLDKFDLFKNSLKDSLKLEGPGFNIFRSKSNRSTPDKELMKPDSISLPETSEICQNGDANAPLFRIDNDLIEVTLDDDDDAGDNISNSSFSLRKTEPSIVPEDDSSSSDTDEISLQKKAENNTSSVISPTKPIRRVVSKSDGGIKVVVPPVKINVETAKQPSDCQLTIFAPWQDEAVLTSSLAFIRPFEFSHAWNCAGPGRRFLSVSVENNTPVPLTLSNPKLRIINSSNAEISRMGRAQPVALKAKGTCTFAWKVKLPKMSPLRMSALFKVSLLSECANVAVDEKLTTSSFKFDFENIDPLYTVRCELESDEVLRCGCMAALHIQVERVKEDHGHEATTGGQQLLMFQVVDNRGRWAVCGKSSGILAFKGYALDIVSDDVSNVAAATLEIMPLVSGDLHLPYVLLHRYMKRRSSEFDERWSSTDSPVLKPPQLKPFTRGEIFFTDQARQVHVKSDDMDSGRALTKL